MSEGQDDSHQASSTNEASATLTCQLDRSLAKRGGIGRSVAMGDGLKSLLQATRSRYEIMTCAKENFGRTTERYATEEGGKEG